MDEPKLPLTVDLDVWRCFATEVRPVFADSYLSGATIEGSVLKTATFVACDRLIADPASRRVLDELGLKPVRPDGTPHPDFRRRRATPEERAEAKRMLKGFLRSA